MQLKEKAAAFSGLLKTELPIAAGICVVAGEIIYLGHLPTVLQTILGFLTGFLISGSAMVSNDYFDLNVDRINHPERPLPSGKVTVPELTAFTLLLSISGFSTAALLGLFPFLAAVVIWAVGIVYNWRLKETGLPGNAMVAASVASTIVFGGLVVGGLASGLVWTFGGLAFLFDLGEEIAGGAMDKEGDKERSGKSLANRKGKKFALHVTGLVFAGFVALSLVPFLAGWLGFPYLTIILAADCATSCFTFKLLNSKNPIEGRKQIRHLYLTLTFAIIAIAILRVIV